MNLAPFIDHTILKNTTTAADVARLCEEAAEYDFAAVCIPPYFVQEAKKALQGSRVKTATVIGFPFGYNVWSVKLFEAEVAVMEGADEIDMVMNIAAFKNGDFVHVESEVQDISHMIATRNAATGLKVIIESGILTDEEIIRCCEMFQQYPVDFLKTSTGFGGDGASVHAVTLMRQHLPDRIQIKASGGIKTYAFAKELIDAGATRLGTSAGLPIIKGEPPDAGY